MSLSTPVVSAIHRPRPADRAPGLFDGTEAPAVGRPAAEQRAAGPAQRPGRGHSRANPSQPALRLVPLSPPIPQAARDLLADASRGVGRAIRAQDAADRYAAAHLAALRAAAAVLAARARPVRGRRGSAWELISRVAPEFAEWAAFFAAGSAKRQAAEAGLRRLVTAREADDMVRQVAAFLDLVEESLAAGTRPGPDQGQRRVGPGQRRVF